MRLSLTAALSLAAAGCGHAAATGSPADASYRQAVNSWTTRAEIYHLADQQAEFIATIESRGFREQRVRERARELGWPAEVELAESQKEALQSDRETSFVVAAFTEAPRENDLADHQSLWRIALSTPVGELEPTGVDRLGRPDANARALYPYMDRFQTSYRIHFPKVAQGPVVLKIASGHGLAELKFEQP